MFTMVSLSMGMCTPTTAHEVDESVAHSIAHPEDKLLQTPLVHVPIRESYRETCGLFVECEKLTPLSAYRIRIGYRVEIVNESAIPLRTTDVNEHFTDERTVTATSDAYKERRKT